MLKYKFTEQEDGTLEMFVPARLKAIGARRTIVITDTHGEEKELPDKTTRPLVSYLARAHSWRNALDSGEFLNIPQLSGALNLDPSYVGRILRMVNLAPDIQEAIINGTEPNGLTIMKLRGSIPDDWQEQREMLGAGK